MSEPFANQFTVADKKSSEKDAKKGEPEKK
jgi:hypothetical protein